MSTDFSDISTEDLRKELDRRKDGPTSQNEMRTDGTIALLSWQSEVEARRCVHCDILDSG